MVSVPPFRYMTMFQLLASPAIRPSPTATYPPPDVGWASLAVAVVGEGSVLRDPDLAEYQHGDAVTLEAVPGAKTKASDVKILGPEGVETSERPPVIYSGGLLSTGGGCGAQAGPGQDVQHLLTIRQGCAVGRKFAAQDALLVGIMPARDIVEAARARRFLALGQPAAIADRPAGKGAGDLVDIQVKIAFGPPVQKLRNWSPFPS